MEAKDKLLTLVRIACAHRVQGQNEKAYLAFQEAIIYWTKTDLTWNDFLDTTAEYANLQARK